MSSRPVSGRVAGKQIEVRPHRVGCRKTGIALYSYQNTIFCWQLTSCHFPEGIDMHDKLSQLAGDANIKRLKGTRMDLCCHETAGMKKAEQKVEDIYKKTRTVI